MDIFGKFIGTVSSYMYGYVLIALLLAAGIYFSVRTRFVQIRFLGRSFKLMTEQTGKEHGGSSFQALMISTASRVGTGNIIGVTGAILAGGPGAVFWMWMTALLGGASAFVESTLAQIYKKKGKDGFYGGPAYYIQQALHSPLLGGIFAVALILTYMGGFNALAAFNLTDFVVPAGSSPHTTVIIGALVATFSGLVIFGGGKRISQTTQFLVPIMSVIYILVSLVVVIMNINLLPSVIGNIFREAFNAKSVFGGLFGAAMMNGIKRGLYSNEAGIGSAPNAAASADVSHPVKQGIVQSLSVFIDTILICSATAFMMLCSGVDPAGFVDASGNTQNAAFIQASLNSNFGIFGEVFVTVTLVLFAYTTIVGNYYYAESTVNYLYPNADGNKVFLAIYRIAAVLIVFAGSQFKAGLAWDLADVLMGIMALINIPVCIILGGKAYAALKDYERQEKEGKDPQFKAESIGITDTECWK
ncbi:MAG: alanine:cation symporter family protein [Spirochaetaceae bacterium]|nr:alanine:cation symporter family protein [Spirochaetaceae bacterium]